MARPNRFNRQPRGRVAAANASGAAPRDLRSEWFARHAWVEDYRRFDPAVRRVAGLTIGRSARSLSGSTFGARLVAKGPINRRKGPARGGKKAFVEAEAFFPSRVGFAVPSHVIRCVKRQQRKEVIFAMNKAGRGKPKQRRPRRNEFSQVRC